MSEAVKKEEAKEEKKLINVSVSPHVRSHDSTRAIMIDVAIALVPTLGFGIYQFGLGAVKVILISLIGCVGFEALYNLIAKKPQTISDFSAVVTGLILAVNLPSTVPWYVPLIGSFFAIVIVKMLFGGLGQNFMNPALAARCFLLISFSSLMTDFSVDGVSSATPLSMLANGESVSTLDLFIGFQAGCIGEVSAVAILIGALYLLIRKVITPRIPFTYIISTVVFIWIINLASGGDTSPIYLLNEVLSGGLLVGAFFMATDYVTSPITPKGQILYGVLLGLITALFRTLSSSAEGVSYAIIICNLLVPMIEKATVPKPFGCEKIKHAKGGSK